MAPTSDLQSPRLIAIVRHGETEWSANGRHTSTTDLPLTDAGVAEAVGSARVITALLDGSTPTRIYSSPRQRARLTAHLALGVDEAQVIVDERLAEFDYGDYEGLRTEEIRVSHPGWDLWRDGCPGGETSADVTARCDSFIADLEANDHDGVVIVVCHGHLSRGLTCRLLGWPIEQAAHLVSGTASVAMIATRRGERALIAWNTRPFAAHPTD